MVLVIQSLYRLRAWAPSEPNLVGHLLCGLLRRSSEFAGVVTASKARRRKPCIYGDNILTPQVEYPRTVVEKVPFGMHSTTTRHNQGPSIKLKDNEGCVDGLPRDWSTFVVLVDGQRVPD